MEAPKPARGRPPTPPDKQLVLRSIRLTPGQWAKIDAAGVAKLRALLDRWKPK